MKKLQSLFWMVSLSAAGVGFSPSAQAASDSKSVQIHVRIAERFQMHLDRPAIELNEVEAGQTCESDDRHSVRISVNSNHGTPWSIHMQAAPLVHSDGTTRIPEKNFEYRVSRVENGRETPLPQSGSPVPTAPQLVFTSSPNEADAALKLGVRLAVPPGQKSGDYSTTLHLILSDTF
jgi:hypothetical protein